MKTECCNHDCGQSDRCPLRDMPATTRLHSRAWLAVLIVWTFVIAAALLRSAP